MDTICAKDATPNPTESKIISSTNVGAVLSLFSFSSFDVTSSIKLVSHFVHLLNLGPNFTDIRQTDIHTVYPIEPISIA